MLGGGGMVGGVNLDCVLTSAGESGMVESFPVRSARGQQSDTVEVITARTDLHTVGGIATQCPAPEGGANEAFCSSAVRRCALTSCLFIWMLLPYQPLKVTCR